MSSDHKRSENFATLVIVAAVSIGLSGQARADCTDTNTCFGDGALQSNTTGNSNSAFGYFALPANLSGSGNTAVGAQSLEVNTTGSKNTAVGLLALSNNPTGNSNTAVGSEALTTLFGATSSGNGNTAIGARAISNLTSGSSNTAVGIEAMAGQLEEGGSIRDFDRNTATGARAMSYVTRGQENTAVGANALQGGDSFLGSTSNFNTAVGSAAMLSVTGGSYNTATGYRALLSGGPGISGDWNTANGADALAFNTSGAGNTAVGFSALRTNSSGIRNTAGGIDALRAVTTGFRNTALGAGAGKNITTGSDNITIGAEVLGGAAQNGVIRIGTSAHQKKAYIAGIRGVSTGLSAATTVFIDANGQLGTIKSSRAVKEEIQSMGNISERLMALRPVTFRYKQADEDGSKPMQFGLIAEEVAETFPELVVYDEEGEPETVSYHLLATLLLNEFQKEHIRVTELQQQSSELARLKKQVALMAEVIERLDRDRMVATNR